MSIAFLFPGQGAQRPGFLHHLPEHPAVRRTFEEARASLSLDPLTLDSATALESTVSVQLGLLIAGVAVARALNESGVVADFVAGHSVGTFAAAVAAGALNYSDALRLVQVRAESMQHAYPTRYGMAAVVGLTEAVVDDLLDAVSTPTATLFVAAINAPDQIIVSGPQQSLQTLIERALRSGARKAYLLAVPVPSHCRLMSGVADRLAFAMRSVELRSPRLRYVCNHSARVAQREQDIAADLIQGVAKLVRWYESTRLMVELGVDFFVELPPGRALTDLAGSAFPDCRTLALDQSTLESAAWLAARVG